MGAYTVTPGQDASAYHAGARAVPVDAPAQDGHAVAECLTMTGGELRALRKAADISQTGAAELCEVSLRSYQRRERKKRLKDKVPADSIALEAIRSESEAAAATREE